MISWSHFRLDDAMAAVPKIQLIYACVLDLYQQSHAKVSKKRESISEVDKQQLTDLQSWLFFFHK